MAVPATLEPRATSDRRPPWRLVTTNRCHEATVRATEVADGGGKAHHLRSKPRTALCTQKASYRERLQWRKEERRMVTREGARSAVVVTARGVGSTVAMAEAGCRGGWSWKVVCRRWGRWGIVDGGVSGKSN
ncbi:hypothetical protein NL676_010196 [Syzygium grande]|nr:hypothetical protein NL676_010196 [Syzygium grande]